LKDLKTSQDVLDIFKHRRLDRYDLCAVALILLATLLRLALIALGWPAPYNDEGTVGLMALHIAYHGAHPLLYYGQDYMGSLEAYLGAGFFHLFGPSTFALRLGLLLLFALFLICMYCLTALLYTKGLALITLALLALGSPEVIFRQLMAAGGPPDYFFFTTLLLLLTAWLAFSANRSHEQQSNNAASERHQGDAPPTPRLPLPRLIAYAAWGAIAGLAIWSHLLCLPFVGCAGLLLLLFCRRELRFSTLLVLALCLLIGMSPLLIYKATVPVSPYENSLFGGGYREPSYPSPFPTSKQPRPQATISPKPIPPIPGLQVAGTILVSIPVATNGTALCPLSPNEAWPLTDRESTYTLLCTGIHGVWGLGFIVLWCIATISAMQRLRRHWWSSHKQKSAEETIRQAGRLMILLGSGSTLLVFMLYPQAAGVTPWNSARYLIGLLIALPAVLAPLWEKRTQWKKRASTLARSAVRYGVLLLLFITCLLGTINTFTTQVPLAQAGNRQQNELIEGLLQKGGTYIYADYDDCNRISFLSNERIICAALDKGLHPGLDRYFPYRKMVAQAPHPFYVLQNGSAQAFLFEQKAAQQHITYHKSIISGYSVYEPTRHLVI